MPTAIRICLEDLAAHAYTLYVLAMANQAGRGRRDQAERIDRLPTPLAKAQIAAALRARA